jgi:hypothetical protein
MKQQAVSFSDRQSLLTELKDNREHQWDAVFGGALLVRAYYVKHVVMAQAP